MTPKKNKAKADQAVPFTWDERRNLAAQLVAEGRKTQAVIAAEVGIARKNLWEWSKRPEFKARVEEIVASSAAALQEAAIRLKETRLANQQARIEGILGPINANLERNIRIREDRLSNLQDRDDKMRALMEARAKYYMNRVQAGVCDKCGGHAEHVPGGETGLLVPDYRATGVLGTLVTKFDAALLREMREHEKQAAIEVGEWTEKQEHKHEFSKLSDSELIAAATSAFGGDTEPGAGDPGGTEGAAG